MRASLFPVSRLAAPAQASFEQDVAAATSVWRSPFLADAGGAVAVELLRGRDGAAIACLHVGEFAPARSSSHCLYWGDREGAAAIRAAEALAIALKHANPAPPAPAQGWPEWKELARRFRLLARRAPARQVPPPPRRIGPLLRD